ncbi:MAG: DUF5060 domain-containing protein [Planctomycetota bacterium]|nr:MAG: DUF5060 domain-containing protein [Planctomycetota bacterium]
MKCNQSNLGYVNLFLILCILIIPASSDGATAKLWEYHDWTFINTTYSGNPYELIATALFTHTSSGTQITTELFYNENNTWKLRFTGIETGEWTFVTTCSDPDLDDLTGSVDIQPNPGVAGFMTRHTGGNRWGRLGLDENFVPQYAMYSSPDWYYDNPVWIDDGIETFFGDHGFNGLHTIVLCRWFDLYKTRYTEFSTTNPDPDPRTFEALELLITKVHAAGGLVHIWAWGDEQRQMTPIGFDGGKNGTVDQRLQRYICARLGPLPGWSMGYGWDLQEWVNYSDLQTWHNYMKSHLGWPHFLGGRSPDLTQIYSHSSGNQECWFSSYQQHRPDYNKYVEAIEQKHTGMPSFMTDRFRVRIDVYPEKDYTEEMTRRGLYHSTMAGGVGNIWGYLVPDYPPDGSTYPYPNKHWILTYSRFFGLMSAIDNRNRFTKDMVRDNNITDGICFRESNTLYIFYKEDTSSITMNLSAMDGPRFAVAVDTTKNYEELPLGQLSATNHVWYTPYSSDWVVAVGNPIPVSPLSVDLGRIDIEKGLFRVTNSDGNTIAVHQGDKICRRNKDVDVDFYVYFNVAGSYAYQGSRSEVYIMVDYFDTGTGALTMEYDAVGGDAYKNSGSVILGNTNAWKQHTYIITDAYFGNRQNGGADFRISKSGGGVFYLDVVHVSEDSPPLTAPVISEVVPDPDTVFVGVEYTRQLTLDQGYPLPSWSVVQGPPGVQVNEFGLVSGWVTTGEDAGEFLTFEITANNSQGSDTEQWVVKVKSIADIDDDGDVDQEDFGHFQTCFSGDGRPYGEGCEDADFDADNDVDLYDYRKFSSCMGGTNNPPGC